MISRNVSGVFLGILMHVAIAVHAQIGSEAYFYVVEGHPSIGVTSLTVAHAASVLYPNFQRVLRASNVSGDDVQYDPFKVRQPKFVLPAVNTPDPLALDSKAVDVILSTLGEGIATSFRSNYRPTKQYYDKYSLSIRANL